MRSGCGQALLIVLAELRPCHPEQSLLAVKYVNKSELILDAARALVERANGSHTVENIKVVSHSLDRGDREHFVVQVALRDDGLRFVSVHRDADGILETKSLSSAD
jgi:hypothetical protein